MDWSKKHFKKIKDCIGCKYKDICCGDNPNAKKGRSIIRKEDKEEIKEYKKKMETPEAKEIYKKRSQIAEFPNAWIKEKLKFRQFALRGLEKTGIESKWICITYNIQQYLRLCWRTKFAFAKAA